MRRRPVAAVLSIPLVAAVFSPDDWRPPEAAASLEAYVAAYPKTSVTPAAREVEALCARLGIDATQASRGGEGTRRERTESPQRPPAEIAQFVRRELENPGDDVGAPLAPVVKFIEDNDATIKEIENALAGRRELAWDLDVGNGLESPLPNLAGLTSLQRVLAARGLLDLRRSDSDAALIAIECMWRLAESLASRPELICQLIATSQARMAVGLLRKVRAPAYGWERRLREHLFFEAFLASFQNDPWPAANNPEMRETIETLTRIYRRFAEGLIERSPCTWSWDDLRDAWDVAVSGESDSGPDIAMIASDLIVDGLMRSYRLLLDSELTALVVEARAERAASREDEWPVRLPNLESSICPGRFYSYQQSGGVVLGFEGSAPAGEGREIVLPLRFRGAPPPTRTPTPTPSVLTPTPTPHTLPL